MLTFWAKTSDPSWDLEQFRVLVSTTSLLPEDFEVVINSHYVQGEDYIEASGSWAEYTFDLSEFAGNEYLYIGFQCISELITLNGLFIDDFEVTGTVGMNNYELGIANYELKQNYPNPFNPITKISYQLSVNSDQLVEIVVHNSMGQQVWSSPVTRYGSRVSGSILFDGSKFNSGVYYYSLVVDGRKIHTKSMVLIK